MSLTRRFLTAFHASIPLALLALGGCTVISGAGMEDMVDRSTTTNSIRPVQTAAATQPDPNQVSDSRTVRNAVSAADIGRIEAEPLAWVNADTGASGTITAIHEVRAGDQICRSFKTSRQSFDGIALYDGEACTSGRGEWTLTRFNEGR